ncbi:uncharacterized protein LOC144884785 [Branchiostoma floridae x Branchiostoma japonicum]
MATTKTTPSPEGGHTAGEGVGVTEPSSGRHQAVQKVDAKRDVPKSSSGRQPNECKPGQTRDINLHNIKEEVSSSITKKDLKIRSKAANRGKHAYDHTIIGRETGAGPSPSICTDNQPAVTGPRYIHVGDHVVMCSEEYESGDAYGYREPNQVNKGYEEGHCTHDYDKPEDVYGYKKPNEVRQACAKESCSDAYDKPEDVYRYKEPNEVRQPCSHDYDKPEDVYRYNDPEEVSFAYWAKGRFVEMWSNWKSSRGFRLAMGCALLFSLSVVIAGILATRITPGWKLKQNGTMILEDSTPWKTTFFDENNSALDKFAVVKSTPTYLPYTNSSVTANALPITIAFLSTTDLNKCIKNPCQHGHCMNQDGGYKCTCSQGWTGKNCQQDINECDGRPNPCKHGRCVNQDGGYNCTCSPGWTGQNCQQGELERTVNRISTSAMPMDALSLVNMDAV